MSSRPNSIDMHVGGRLRMRRMMIGMSQERLGHELGVTFQQIQKYEKGTNRIGASRLFDMSRVLEVEIGYFFEGLGTADRASRPGSERLSEFIATPEGVALNSAFAAIADQATRKRIIELVKTLSGDMGALRRTANGD